MDTSRSSLHLPHSLPSPSLHITKVHSASPCNPFLVVETPPVTHWGQRGCYPGGKVRVFSEFLNNIPSICPLGKLKVFWRFIFHFALKKPSRQSESLFKKSPPLWSQYTQWANWEFDHKKPTNIPLSHSLKKPSGFFHKLVQNMPTICLSHSSKVLS